MTLQFISRTTWTTRTHTPQVKCDKILIFFRTSRALWEAVFSVLLNVATPSDETCLTPRESPLPSLVKKIEEHIANAR